MSLQLSICKREKEKQVNQEAEKGKRKDKNRQRGGTLEDKSLIYKKENGGE